MICVRTRVCPAVRKNKKHHNFYLQPSCTFLHWLLCLKLLLLSKNVSNNSNVNLFSNSFELFFGFIWKIWLFISLCWYLVSMIKLVFVWWKKKPSNAKRSCDSISHWLRHKLQQSKGVWPSSLMFFFCGRLEPLWLNGAFVWIFLFIQQPDVARAWKGPLFCSFLFHLKLSLVFPAKQKVKCLISSCYSAIVKPLFFFIHNYFPALI